MSTHRNEARSQRKKITDFARSLEKEYGCHLVIFTAFSEEDHPSNTSTSMCALTVLWGASID